MTRRTLAASLTAAALLALGLGGCTAAGPSAAPTDDPSPLAAAAPAQPAATASASATCENVMTPDAYAKIEADGLEQTLFTPFDPIATKITESGGLTCAWGKPQTDLVVAVAQVATGDDETAWLDALAAGGYTRTDDPVAGAHSGRPDTGNGIAPVAIVADGMITFVNVPAYAGWVTPAS